MLSRVRRVGALLGVWCGRGSPPRSFGPSRSGGEGESALPVFGLGCYRYEFAPVELAVPAARHAVRGVCVLHGLDAFGPELVVAELVANALRHTAVHDFVGLTVRVGEGRVAIEVSDPGADAAGFLDSPAVPGDTDGHGRGLLLVGAVSERVDIAVSAGRKQVRALIAVERAR